MFAAAPGDARDLPEGFAEAVGATHERCADVEAYRRMLVEENARTNLVGASTLGDFWRRHVLDSAQLVWFAPEARTWADLGSGAGLPGVVLAILMKDRPGGLVHLIESRTKRCAFVARVVDALRLPAEVHHARCESLRLEVEAVTARACAPLPRLLGLAKPYLDLGAKGLFLKGKDAADEIAEARSKWRFAATVRASLSDPRGRVVMIEGLTRAS